MLAVMFVAFEGPVLYYEWKLGARVVDLKIRPGTALLLISAAYYGIHRAVSLHPYYRQDYRKWLERTPWDVDKSLPMGPIELIWEDGLVLGVLILANLCLPVHHSVRILNMFLIAHSILLTFPLWHTGAGAIGYLCAFGTLLAVRTWARPWVCFAVAASVYLLAYEGLWQSLARFPWRLNWSWSDFDNSKHLDDKLSGPACGWPYDRFFRDIKVAERNRMGLLDRVLVSMLCGWVVFCLLGLVPDPRDRPAASGLAVPVLIGVILGRVGLYVAGYPPPISLAGRMRTGRLIIPGYDRCLAAPVLAGVAGITAYECCRASAVPPEFCVPVMITVVMLVLLITPPSLKVWRLTGRYRMAPGAFVEGENSEFVKAG